MENLWIELAKENRLAVSLLRSNKCWRSAVSRAYYCVYAQLTASLLVMGVNMPKRGNPEHASLSTLILNNLNVLSHHDRGELAGKLMTLYSLRINADYGPSYTVDDSDMRVALGCMVWILQVTNDIIVPRK